MTDITVTPWIYTDYPHVPKEIVALVEHHLVIIKRRFPDYKCETYEWPEHYWLRVEISNGKNVLLVASFTSSSINIATAEAPGPDFAEVIDYADPRFTDNVIIDTLERLGR